MTRLRTAVAVICLTGLVALTAGSAAASAATNAAPAAAVSTGSTGPGLDTIGRQGRRGESPGGRAQGGARNLTARLPPPRGAGGTPGPPRRPRARAAWRAPPR